MKLYFTIFLFLLFGVSVSAQSYEFYYKENIRYKNLPDFDLSKTKVDVKSDITLDSALLNSLMQSIMKEKLSSFNIIQKVTVKHDTAFTELFADEAEEGIRMNITDKKRMFYKGRRVDKYEKDADSDRRTDIFSSGETKKVLNFPCELYASKDGKYKVWFCKSLSASINPGITGLSVYPEAILACDIEEKESTHHAELTEIRKLN